MRTTRTLFRPSRAAAAVAAALTLAACGSGDDPTIASGGDSSGGVEASPVAGIDAQHNDADIAFITDMTPHHESAIDMAELAADRAADPRVKDLAERIVAAQDPEIETMQKMATAWGVDLEAGGSPHGGSAKSSGGPHGGGGAEGDDVTALEPLSGAAFDKEFLSRMTAHHESALEMAQKELSEGENPQAKELAQAIVTAQTEEIAEMKTILAEL